MEYAAIFSPKGRKHRGSVLVKSFENGKLVFAETHHFKIRKGDTVIYPFGLGYIPYWNSSASSGCLLGLER